MAKYTIKKVSEIDGVWFRAYDETGDYVIWSVGSALELCEKKLRIIVDPVKTKSEVVKELEIP